MLQLDNTHAWKQDRRSLSFSVALPPVSCELWVTAALLPSHQVFVITRRESLDFAVFMMYLITFLGAAMFAFFQLTGGNIHFLRVSDGLGVMGRLAFGAQV
jgi:hypothetical protein